MDHPKNTRAAAGSQAEAAQEQAKAERAARQAAALRENLRRRKAQARLRADSTDGSAQTDPPNSAISG